MKYYPIHIDLSNRRCLIVGGGIVAYRKLQRLLECSALVTVISPRFEPDFLTISTKKNLELIPKKVQKQDINDYFMIFATTSDKQVNLKLAKWARQKNILCNIADNPVCSDFILPSVIEQGDLNITISTNAKSPALSKHIRMQLSQTFGEEYAIFLTIMGKLRDHLCKTDSTQNERKIKYHELINRDIIQKIKEKDIQSISRLLVEITGYSLNEIVDQNVMSQTQ